MRTRPEACDDPPVMHVLSLCDVRLHSELSHVAEICPLFSRFWIRLHDPLHVVRLKRMSQP